MSPAPPEPSEPTKRPVTVRAIIVSLLIGAFVAGTFPYVILYMGFGPNVSLMSTFLAFLILGAIGTAQGGRPNRYELNLSQVAGVTTGQVAFMCVLLGAFDLLRKKPGLNFTAELDGPLLVLWLALAGWLGILLSIPVRRYYIEKEKLPFVGGASAAEAIVVLDGSGEEARKRAWALGAGLVAAAGLAALRDLAKIFAKPAIMFGETLAQRNVGLGLNLLSFGSGMLFGLRIVLSMGLGMLVGWVILPSFLVERGLIAKASTGDIIAFTIWPATAMMVAGGFTGLALKWRIIASALRRPGIAEGSTAAAEEPFSRRTLTIAVIVLVLALCVVQWQVFDIPIWLTFLTLVLAMPLMWAGTRVLGETNWAPISAMANVSQAVLAVVAPGNLNANMVGSGLCGTIPANGEHLMQNYRAAHILGVPPRHVAYLQLGAVVLGAVVLALVYPMLIEAYGIGAGGKLSSPISVKWASFGELLSQGFAVLPKGAVSALIIAAIAGVILAVLEVRWPKFVPSPTAAGMAMLIPATVVTTMVLGGVAKAIWARFWPKREAVFSTPLASGLIAGEALMAVAISIIKHVKGIK